MHQRNNTMALQMPAFDNRQPGNANHFRERRGSMPLIDNAQTILSSKKPVPIMPGTSMARDHASVSNYINIMNQSPLRAKSRNYHLPPIDSNANVLRSGDHNLSNSVSPKKILNRGNSVL